MVLEGVEGCDGSGYSKKESQQLASKLTLERLRREPQFIDKVFAAKTDRTKMEEEPVENVPSTEQTSDDFIIANPVVEAHAEAAVEALNHGKKKRERRSPMYRNDSETQPNKTNETAPQPETEDNLNLNDSEFDLSHISALEQSREDIIAAAEAAAFGGKE